MSEYQYYEWQTIDRALTPDEQAEVKRLSSHIDVTSTHAVVTYNWGNFKHDPKAVLTRYFDAFLYYANWGSKQLMFRFPCKLLDQAQIEPYLWEDCVELKPSGEYLLLNIELYSEDDYEEFDEEDSTLSVLARLRDDILQGDFRTLYLAWLIGVENANDDVEDDDSDFDEEVEPPVPPGLQALSAALTGFVRFFKLDPYLIEAAARASPSKQATPSFPVEDAITRLSADERDAFLVRLARGEAHLSLAFNRRLRELAGQPVGQHAAAPRRTWGELKHTAAQMRAATMRREREAARKKQIQEMEALAQREAQVWQEVEAFIQQKQTRAYAEAETLLLKLRELAIYQGRLAAFQSRVRELQAQYANRPALQERLRRVLSKQ